MTHVFPHLLRKLIQPNAKLMELAAISEINEMKLNKTQMGKINDLPDVRPNAKRNNVDRHDQRHEVAERLQSEQREDSTQNVCDKSDCNKDSWSLSCLEDILALILLFVDDESLLNKLHKLLFVLIRELVTAHLPLRDEVINRLLARALVLDVQQLRLLVRILTATKVLHVL